MSPRLLLATCAKRPALTPDDTLLAEALQRLGIDSEARPWTKIAPHDEPTPILLRSTWDYHQIPDRFAGWLDALASGGRRVLNPAAVARWNMDKRYLRDLERAGVAIPRTCWLERPTVAEVRAALERERWPSAVLKPRIGATAYGTLRVGATSLPADHELEPAQASGALLQEFLPEIVDGGELSLVFVEGEFSHAVRKRPQPGDFRVQGDFGGTYEPTAPSSECLAFARAALAAAPDDVVYARVDLVETSGGPRLMELELIEPELYFRLAPGGADRLAAAVAGRLTT
jgi:glutathione synthase/RimK-type ligase-like ATP-grasp enzyme